jgi:hypothetical protein
MISAPYNLEYGDNIYAKLLATNIFGDSPVSNSGGGATVVVVPDAPIDLIKDTTVSSKSIIKFSWTEAAFNGGMPVIDFQIIFDQAEGLYITLDTTTATEYTTAFEVSPGSTYSFAV